MSNETVTTTTTPTRESIRAAILATKTPKTKIIKFFGQDIELHQPSVGDILANATDESEVSKAIIYRALINHAYVPGTNTRLFDETDLEVFKSMPFGEDFTRVTKAYAELSDINFPSNENT